MKKNSSFLGAFFKKGYCFLSIVLIIITSMVFYFGFKQATIDNILSNQKTLIYFGTFVGFNALIIFIFIFSSFKKKINVGDSIIVSFLFSPLIYVAYIYFLENILDLTRFIIAGSFFLLNLIFFIVRCCTFKNASEEKPFYKKNSIKNYLSALFSKYSVYTSLFIAVAIDCFCFMFSFSKFIQSNFIKDNLFITLLYLLPIVIYAAISYANKKICMFDSLLFAVIFSLPIIGVQAYLQYMALSLKLYIILGILAVAIISIIIRTFAVDFDVSEVKDELPPTRPVKDYFSKLFNKHNVYLAISLAGVVSFILLFTNFRYSNIFENITIATTNIEFTYDSIPFVFINYFGYASAIIACLYALANIKKKNIHKGDFCILYCLAFIIYSFISLTQVFSYTVLLGLIPATFIVFAIISARIRYTFNK